jgi:hypothetical protein
MLPTATLSRPGIAALPVMAISGEVPLPASVVDDGVDSLLDP